MRRLRGDRPTLRLATLLAAAATIVAITACSGPVPTPARGSTGNQSERHEPPVVIDPTKPVAFVQLGSDVQLGSGQAAAANRVEVTDPAALDEYLRGLHQGAVRSLRSQLTARLPVASSDRLFAFLLTGCAETGAELAIGARGTGDRGLSARLTGGENTNCYVPVYFVAIFSVPDHLLR